ncbi:hypothetical protein [Azospirillum sp. TSH100]|uniref:hypothetical protein n=1 Tax=Azospirillum sp. TSH100 TaxID=652764 RepID=UPI001FFF48D9|nr:hypothetical protein [Azospirillum sp. TSH100]
MNWSITTKVPGGRCSFSEPTADTDRISVTPSCFSAWMLARKFSSDGGMRWPRPWRGRKTSFWLASSPVSSSSDGSPKGVVTVTQRVFSSPSMSYRPLPPITPRTVSPTAPLLMSRSLR